jgi:hypothetical protein
MKILDAGDHPLSNADVLDWVKRKRAQHEKENVEDKTQGLKPGGRPKNFMRMLQRTERELSANHYPYAKNPSAYEGDARRASFRKVAMEIETVIQDSLEEEWKDRLPQMTQEQMDKTYEPVQEKKCLTVPELLMIFNHAPVCVEMLQPMIESVEERFTPEEQQAIIDVIVKNLRCDEGIAQEG